MLDTFADQAWAKRTWLLAEFNESPRAELWLTVLGLFEMPWGVIGYGSGGAALKLAELGYETPHNILMHIYILILGCLVLFWSLLYFCETIQRLEVYPLL